MLAAGSQWQDSLIEKGCQLTVLRGDNDTLNYTYRTVVYCEMEMVLNYVGRN